MKLCRTALLLVVAVVFAGAMERQPNADYHARRVELAKSLEGGAFILFAPTEAEGPNNLYGFHQEDNFYYLTGWSEPGAAVFVNSNPYLEILFLPEHNLTQEKWTGPKLGPESPDAPKITGFDRVESLSKMRDELVKVLPQPRVTVYAELGSNGQTTASTGPVEWLRRSNSFPNYVSFRDARPVLTRLRMLKDEREVQLIAKATDASVAAHLAALKAIRPNANEHDISALMQFEFQKRGCERPAYAPIVGSGFYSTVLHYSVDDKVMNAGDLVVMDVAGEYSMYASDITRTAPVSGKFTPRQREIYDIVLGAQEAAMRAFELGKSKLSGQDPNSLYKVALDYINSHGKDLHGQPLGKYFIHGLGHPVGLNVHDPFDPTVPLAKGMVFTLEPGIYIGEEKLGVRIEDVYYVDPATGKLVLLSKGLPRTADEVEHAMAVR